MPKELTRTSWSLTTTDLTPDTCGGDGEPSYKGGKSSDTQPSVLFPMSSTPLMHSLG